MKAFSKLVIAVMGLAFSVGAMGGGSVGGGGWGKTRLMLQNFAYDSAVLSIGGTSSLPESETAHLLVIPEDEYKDFLVEYEKEQAGGEPFLLEVPVKGGCMRYFSLQSVVITGTDTPVLYLLEQPAPKTK